MWDRLFVVREKGECRVKVTAGNSKKGVVEERLQSRLITPVCQGSTLGVQLWASSALARSSSHQRPPQLGLRILYIWISLRQLELKVLSYSTTTAAKFEVGSVGLQPVPVMTTASSIVAQSLSSQRIAD